MIRDILERGGKKSGLIGTVYDIIGDEKLHASHTTPEARDVYEILGKLSNIDSDECVMEVSSQGLKLDRVYGINFNIGCFTNFYEDHIGGNEHPDMDDYLNCKMKIWEQSEVAVINADTPVTDVMVNKAKECGCKIYTYGLSEGCDVRADKLNVGLKNGKAGTFFDLISPWYEGRLFVAIPGKFNVYNALCALTAAYLSGIDTEYIEESLENIQVPGRLQPVKNSLGITILVDYAHNAASLENVLDTLKETTKGRVISVFGCGGDRSHTRRFEMGEVSGNKADYTIVTSDNPRTEDPLIIIGHIVSAIEKTNGKFETIVDRKEAIHKAIEIANPGDIVLIAGKGHEDYQIFKDRTIHFDDAEVAAEAAEQIKEDRL
jgi:UDP-N-acetylmuramoyl-L-alanyl-D-glutamate--2,6-diaminopimelate ligase